jgi:4-hydroxy-3-polyprenylbenzoate decarboxylase
MKSLPLVVAVTGASGAVYAGRLLEVLLAAGRQIHLLVSPSGAAVVKQELGRKFDLATGDVGPLLSALREVPLEERADYVRQVVYHHYQDFMAPPASGSFLTGGMIVCPCSGSTLSGIAHGASNNLIQRAAEVHLKERRKLILVPREAPLSLIQIDNMRRAAEAGAVILPASPGWYQGVRSIDDLVDFVVARILDQLGIEHELMKRWGEEGERQA